jgi:hypothetical protein
MLPDCLGDHVRRQMHGHRVARFLHGRVAAEGATTSIAQGDVRAEIAVTSRALGDAGEPVRICLATLLEFLQG